MTIQNQSSEVKTKWLRLANESRNANAKFKHSEPSKDATAARVNGVMKEVLSQLEEVF